MIPSTSCRCGALSCATVVASAGGVAVSAAPLESKAVPAK